MQPIQIVVSVIIPAKNEEKFIGKCLDSIFNNDFPRQQFEVILVDNGSTDTTVSIARAKGATVVVKPEGTISALRNFGANIAKGEIFAFMDADCTVNRDWLKKAEPYFADKSIVCFGAAPTIPGNATWVQQTWWHVREKPMEFMEVSWLESMNMFIRRQAFNEIGGFNEKLVTCEDVDISYRLAQKGKIVSDKKIKAVHHGEAKNIVDFFKKERWRSKSNYSGFFNHDFNIRELPSLCIPIYYGVSLLCVILSLFVNQYCRFDIFFYLLLLNQLPLLTIGLVKIKRKNPISNFVKIVIIYNVYFMARLSALVYPK